MPSFDYDVTAVPYSQTVPQSVFNVGNQVLFRVTAAVPLELGFKANSGGTFAPVLWVLASDGTTIVSDAASGTGGHNAPLLTADTYYVKITRSGGGASNFDFTVNIDTYALDDFTVEEGDILINDDTGTIPAVLMAADGTLKSYVSSVPAGEIGAILPNRVTAWYDSFSQYHATNRIALLDANLQYLTSVSVGDTGEPNISADATKFWVVNHANTLWTVTAAGVATSTGYTFPGVAVYTFGVNSAGTTLYWARKNSDGKIHALDLNTLTPLTDLYTIPGFVNFTDEIANTFDDHQGDLFVLDDGTIVTFWFDASTSLGHVIHLSAAGVLLHDASFHALSDGIIDHLAIIYGQSGEVLIWLVQGLVNGRIGKLTLATGLISDDFIQPQFVEGYNLQDGPEMFGFSESCTVVTFSPLGDTEEAVGEAAGTSTVLGVSAEFVPGPGDVDFSTFSIRWLRRVPHQRAS